MLACITAGVFSSQLTHNCLHDVVCTRLVLVYLKIDVYSDLADLAPLGLGMQSGEGMAHQLYETEYSNPVSPPPCPFCGVRGCVRALVLLHDQAEHVLLPLQRLRYGRALCEEGQQTLQCGTALVKRLCDSMNRVHHFRIPSCYTHSRPSEFLYHSSAVHRMS
jgi:hypothetical protein